MPDDALKPEDETTCQTEFPFVDFRGLFVGVGAVLAFLAYGIFSSQGRDVPGSVLFAFVPLIGMGSYAFDFAKKNAFALRSSHIVQLDGTTTPAGRIRRAESGKGRVDLFYLDADGREQSTTIALGNVRKDLRAEARTALIAWLRDRDIVVEEKESSYL